MSRKNFDNSSAIKIYTAAVVTVFCIMFIYALLDYVFPLPVDKLESDYSKVHLSGDDDLLRIELTKDDNYRIKVPINQISSYIKQGVVIYEDRFFYYHAGVNPYSVLRAAVLNLHSKRIVSGASTITLQLAKMSEPKERNIFSKLIEVFRSVQLESQYSKDEILEMYLNTIPMGGNIVGVGAASYLYFNKPVSDLTLSEAALLIALPKRPNGARPDRNPEGAFMAKNEVLDRISKPLGFSGRILEEAYAETVKGIRYNNPYKLQHLVVRNPGGDEYNTKYCINGIFQDVMEHKLRTAVDDFKKYGIHNGAAIVVDNTTMKVLCYVGSPDFMDKTHAGEINGANILRSPGSALKPFVYGMAIERGLITPKTGLYDIPKDYDGYAPVNYERRFSGVISAEDALARSLNAPAVQLEYMLGKNGVVSLLKTAGFSDMKRNRIQTGLSAVLGTYPVTLEELVNMYTIFANKGVLKPLVFTENESKGEISGVRLFSEATVYLISEMLARVERPDLPQSWEFTSSRGKVAFKTGTSFGFGDAWCIGYNPKYTVGVWLGNADATPSFKLIGIKAAAPVVIGMFNFLTRYADNWFEKPDDVKIRKVCSVTGDLPGRYCRSIEDDYYIEKISSNRICNVHKKIYVNEKTKTRVDSGNLKGNAEDYKEKIIEDWPVEVAAYLRKEGKHLTEIPDYDEENIPEGTYLKPRILSPVAGSVYRMTNVNPEEYQKIPLNVAVGGGIKKVYWLLNGKVVAQGKPDNTYYLEPEPGEWELVVQDTLGQSDSVTYKVVEQ